MVPTLLYLSAGTSEGGTACIVNRLAQSSVTWIAKFGTSKCKIAEVTPFEIEDHIQSDERLLEEQLSEIKLF